MFKRTLVALVAVLALIVAVPAAANAAVDSDSCNTGGTTFTSSIAYQLYTSGPYYGIQIDTWQWTTTPGADLNRIALQVRWSGTDDVSLVKAAGASAGTLNDVNSSGAFTNIGYTESNPAGARQWRVDAWGGVGNSTDTCTSGWQNFN